ncbi:MAG: VIT family protein [Caldilineaceae bacterium]
MARHAERHYAERIGWLRAAVLGANDGIVSTASLVVGVAAASAVRGEILTAGLAGLVAGAMSMAAGEYVSVSSQADTEKADLAREQQELATDIRSERKELTAIYVERGLTPELAAQVADQLMAHDALGAHARDELGLTEIHTARPIQAALASAITFAIGAALPLLLAWLSPSIRYLARCRRFVTLACAVGRPGRTCRRCQYCHRCRACHAVGSVGNGRHCPRWRTLRRGCLSAFLAHQ